MSQDVQISSALERREPPAGSAPEPADRLDRSIAGAIDRLLAGQSDDGHWCGELEGDSILESEYVLTMHFLGRTAEPRVARAASYLRGKQNPDGGWSIYPDGPPDVSASVKAYFVLKLQGDDAEAPHMRRARRLIRRLGGLDACNSFTRLYLSIFGQYQWARCPAVPPELMLLPRWLPINLYGMSSWSRAIVVPLSIIWALRPYREVPERARIDELRVAGRRPGAPAVGGLRSRLWSAFFRLLDLSIHLAESLRLRPVRRWTLRLAERWILDRLSDSDGLGAIFPPIINTIIALESLGYPQDHPVLAAQIRELEKLGIEDGDKVRLQPCLSPVWDTSLALTALLDAGLEADHPALARAARWLVAREVRKPGDWRVGNPGGPVGGWYFEYANEFYPDCDDTAQVLTGLRQLRPDDPELAGRAAEAADRGLAWMLSMQNRDGGWASFDRGCDREFLTFIPFADHNAMIDPSTTDITGRVLEALERCGFGPEHPAVRAGVGFVRREQEEDGSWYGRWGCNYIYGTWLAMAGLRSAGCDPGDAAIQRGADWLRGCQNPDGGWGELPASYDDPAAKGVGPSTAAQTAWALLGLFAAGDFTGDASRRGVEFLLAAQLPDGGWRDEPWTGTGFPKVFYLRYHLYAIYFPLRALAAYRRALAAPAAGAS